MTKVLPSPDWVLAVDSFSLCNNSSWTSSSSIALHLTDLGVFSGISYESPRSSEEREPIHRITTREPDNENSPFYRDDGVGVKPFARLSFRKLKGGQ